VTNASIGLDPLAGINSTHSEQSDRVTSATLFSFLFPCWRGEHAAVPPAAAQPYVNLVINVREWTPAPTIVYGIFMSAQRHFFYNTWVDKRNIAYNRAFMRAPALQRSRSLWMILGLPEAHCLLQR
jgi:hypothetical protein